MFKMFDFWSQKEEEDIMKQKMKKLVVVLLSMVLIGNFIQVFFQVEPQAAIGMSFNQLQAKFPAGTYWNHVGKNTNNPDGVTNRPCTHHGGCSSKGYTGWCGCNSAGFYGAIQCHGFAFKCGYDMFGSSPSTWATHKNINNIKPGDIIRYKNNHHTIFVTAVDGDTITYGDCNSDGHCIIRWNQKIKKNNVWGLTCIYTSNSTPPIDSGTISTAPVANIYKVEMSEVNYNGFKLTVGVSDTNLVKVRVQSVQTGEVLEPQAEFRSNFDNINYTFSTSQMKNPGKRFKVYIYAYNTDVAGSPEVLHRVTYNMTDSEKEVVVLPDKPVLYNVEKNLSSDMLVTTGDIGGWVAGNNIEKITAIINDKEYECSRCDRNDVAKVYPEYSGTNAGFNFKVNASMANNGDNTLKILAYVSNSDPILIYTGKFKATKLREDYFDWAWYYFKNHNDCLLYTSDAADD